MCYSWGMDRNSPTVGPRPTVGPTPTQMKAEDHAEVILYRYSPPESDTYRVPPERGDLDLLPLQPKEDTEFTCTTCWLYTKVPSSQPGICKDCAGETDQPHTHSEVKQGHNLTKW